MTIRDIIKIDETLCDGCGACVDGCHEGALQLIDGKARVVSELYCDGLGACIGDCHFGAITIEKREAQPYDERAVMDKICAKGEMTILAHIKHLKDHNELVFLNQAIEYITERKIDIDLSSIKSDSEMKMVCGCPGSTARSCTQPTVVATAVNTPSQLTHWPVQLHLINPAAGYFKGADILLAADCTAYSYGDFHNSLLRGRKLVIACPKLDSNKDIYVEKLVDFIDHSQINTLTVAIMSVPCCRGLLSIANSAVERASRRVPIKKIVINSEGVITNNEWV